MFKDPSAVLDYQVDWTSWLGTNEVIDASEWTITPDGLVKDSEANTTSTATVWVSGGALRTQYALTNHITTNQGRQDERTIPLGIREL